MSSGPASVGTTEVYRHLKVEDALAYLERVKRQFGEQPAIYNKFLDIMKNFKAHTIDTPGVIQRVSELFRGHDNLILGFNTFLPAGFKITNPGSKGVTVPTTTATQIPTMLGPPISAATPAIMRRVSPAVPISARAMQAKKQKRSNWVAAAPPQEKKPATNSTTEQQGNQQGTQQGTQQPEFDTAINYVTKIKKRFTDDSGTYKLFLQILHTYQKEQRNIKQVLDEVSHLFRDHPDLLKEFTYFLPDAVQEVAKTRMTAAAARSERRLLKQRREKRARENNALQQATNVRSEKMISNNMNRNRNGKRPRLDSSSRRDEEQESIIPANHIRFIERVKSSLKIKSMFTEFMKLLIVWYSKIITARELLILSSNILGSCSALQIELKKILKDVPEDEDDLDSIYLGLPVSGIDFSNCRACTQSYRALPSDFPSIICSARSKEMTDLFNDEWVSVPTGSEDYTTKNMIRNIPKEALFACEDERFEVDMMIDAAKSTVYVLLPMNAEIDSIHEEGSSRLYKLDKRSLSSLHMKSIARIYGEQSDQILELMAKNPVGAIPIVLQRLKQKIIEWENSKKVMEEGWKHRQLKNYYKSLDQRSLSFSMIDKKTISSRQIISNIKRIVIQSYDQNEIEWSLMSPDERAAIEKKAPLPTEAHLIFDFPPPTTTTTMTTMYGTGSSSRTSSDMHKECMSVIMDSLRSSHGAIDCARVQSLIKSILSPLFSFPPEYFTSKLPHSLKETEALDAGTVVTTPYGSGTIVGFNAGHYPNYIVTLSFGTAYLSPEQVKDGAGRSCKEDESGDDNDTMVVEGEEDDMVIVDDSPTTTTTTTTTTTGGLDGNGPVLESGKSGLFHSSAYLFLSSYKLLFDRLVKAKAMCEDTSTYTQDDMQEHPEDYYRGYASPSGKRVLSGNEYSEFKSCIHSLLSGDLSNDEFADEISKRMGLGGYVIFTIEKLIRQLLKHLSSFASETGVTRLFLKYKGDGGDEEYLKDAATVISEMKTPSGVYKVHVEGGKISITCFGSTSLILKKLGVIEDGSEDDNMVVEDATTTDDVATVGVHTTSSSGDSIEPTSSTSQGVLDLSI